MYSSDTDAHNHVNSHVQRRITYVTCQTSHTYNTLPVLFSNLLPSSRVVAQISSLLATLLYENQQYICFNISLLYQFISSHQFHQPSYYISHFKRELCKHHVRDPESTRLRKKHLLSPISSELTCSFSATNYRYCTTCIRKCKKKYIMCFNFVLSCNTFGLV